MAGNARPYVWEMLREGMAALDGQATNVALRDWILKRYPDTNVNTIGAEIISRTVNHPSRIHYPVNQRPRIANDERFDFLYRPERGRLQLYDPDRHGVWQIAERDDETLAVALVEDVIEASEIQASPGFAAEDHLRDFLAGHLDVVEPGLALFVDEDGIQGVEYATPVGRMDILAVDRNGRFLVIELKVRRSPDAAAAQLLRYRNWVQRHLANHQSRVRACLIAGKVSDKLRYALADAGDVILMEYDLDVRLREVPGLDGDA